MQKDDAAPVAECLNGDKRAFAVLVERHKGTVAAIAYQKLGNTTDVEDIVQESFLRAYQALPNLKDKTKFAGWLCKIASNLCMEWRQKRNSAPTVSLSEFRVEQIEHSQPDMDSVASDQGDLKEHIRHALSQMSDLDREVIALRYTEGLSCIEIAKQLNATPAAIYSRFQRIMKTLREKVKRL